MKLIEEFIFKLKSENIYKNCINQYSENVENSIITRNNLYKYLSSIYGREIKYIFVGEAPGYKGCRITGIPFTSEYILTKKIQPLNIFGLDNGYKVISPKLYKESTATIVWEIFEKTEFIPLFWNAFPFHPHKEDNTNSNRKPNKSELVIGFKYLDMIIDIFKPSEIIAIGKVSYKLLIENGFDCKYIRHPSNGGKNDFIQGIKQL